MSLNLASRIALRHLLCSIRQIGELATEPSHQNLFSVITEEGEKVIKVDEDTMQQLIKLQNLSMDDVKMAHSILGTMIVEHAKAVDVALAVKYLVMHPSTRRKELDVLEKTNPGKYTDVKAAIAWCKQVKPQREPTWFIKKKKQKRRGRKKK